MKLLKYYLLLAGLLFHNCRQSFLEIGPKGTVNESTLMTKAGVNGLLTGAYSYLDGVGTREVGKGSWFGAVSNWIFSLASDDAHKGSEFGDGVAFEQIENYSATSVNNVYNDKWIALYDGVQRANEVIRILAKLPAGVLSEDEATQIKAEAVFLRGVYHLEAAKIWENVPFISEDVSFANQNYKVSNKIPVWPKIEDDFRYAAERLTPTKSLPGRANSWAAKAFLAKSYLFQHKYEEARVLLTEIIAGGTTASGQKYDLGLFSDNFNPSRKNGPESVFAVQMSIQAGTNGQTGNPGDVLTMPIGGPSSCCGFYQPSFSLVNSFRTDPNGLPYLDSFNDHAIKSDQGTPSVQPFTPDEGAIDPRLDYTVGRRGIPYLDWGIMPGSAWVRAQSDAGPYIGIKNVYYKAAKASTSTSYNGWATATANNYNMIRFADVLLWAAEAEVEVGSLKKAEELVNRVRARAANPAGWVKQYLDKNDPSKGFSAVPAANYKIGLYKGEFESKGQNFAREAVRFERKIELAMEGHRIFDLRRYDNGSGYMAEKLNAFVTFETGVPNFSCAYLVGAKFQKGKNELFPIPQAQIDLSVKDGSSTLVQNPNH
ncbi:RagB/SusD family nutrient uptake outer membrane protein [Ravibacter arvi]|uniref:RagB/SusD family nutrient uptake outer membrane protein n=1 Tax=Ravibacter arvi TaxID=2051041 RepID=A0ABP8LVX3_9BACT